MATERGFRTKLRYRSDEFLSSGAGKQLFLLLVLTCVVVFVFAIIALAIGLPVGDTLFDKCWFYFTRAMDGGTMGGDEGTGVRLVSTGATVVGVILTGLLISALSGNFQDRLESIKRGASPVVEKNHFLILGWSEKIFSVIDQLSEANIEKGKIIVVVMAARDKVEMEEELRDKLTHLDRIKLVVRSGSSESLTDLSKVAFDMAHAIVVLLNDEDVSDPNKADGRVIKTLMALYNHPEGKGAMVGKSVTAEVMLAENQEIAIIAGSRKAQVVKTNEMISKIILQTSRISGLSLVYDELLRFEGNEFHIAKFPQLAGRRFGDIILDFPNGCPVGVARPDGTHQINPPSDYLLQPTDDVLILAEDDHIQYAPYQGPLRGMQITPAGAATVRPMEHMLVLGWNEKIFPIVTEFDSYAAKGSTLTMVNSLEGQTVSERLKENCGELKNIQTRHMVGEFTSRALMENLQPQNYPTVMVLGDASSGEISAEDADTRAIIALLLLRDFQRRSGIATQEICSEILNPKNRELAATTEIHDIVISNEMVSMVLAQVSHVPRILPVLDDLFQSEGSEIYLKDIAKYVPYGQQVTFEYLMLAARARNEVAFGLQRSVNDASKRYGIVLNPTDRSAPFVVNKGDRLIVLAEDDG